MVSTIGCHNLTVGDNEGLISSFLIGQLLLQFLGFGAAAQMADAHAIPALSFHFALDYEGIVTFVLQPFGKSVRVLLVNERAELNRP